MLHESKTYVDVASAIAELEIRLMYEIDVHDPPCRPKIGRNDS